MRINFPGFIIAGEDGKIKQSALDLHFWPRKESLTGCFSAKKARAGGNSGTSEGVYADKGGYFVIIADMLRANAVGSSTGSPAMRRAC